MKSTTKTFVAVVTLIVTALSSVASENASPGVTLSRSQQTLTAPNIVTRKIAFKDEELAKYQLLGRQSQDLALKEAAGASGTTKTVLVVVAVVVVVAGVALLAASHGGKTLYNP